MSNKKLEKVLQILKNAEKLNTLNAYKDYVSIFEENNNKVSDKDINQLNMEYIKTLFTILKIQGGER